MENCLWFAIVAMLWFQPFLRSRRYSCCSRSLRCQKRRNRSLGLVRLCSFRLFVGFGHHHFFLQTLQHHRDANVIRKGRWRANNTSMQRSKLRIQYTPGDGSNTFSFKRHGSIFTVGGYRIGNVSLGHLIPRNTTNLGQKFRQYC